MTIFLVNPRTDGCPGHLSTDGGGADNRSPPEISKTKQARDKRLAALYTDGRALQFLPRTFLGQVKNDITEVKKIKMAAIENNRVFFNNFWTEQIFAKMSWDIPNWYNPNLKRKSNIRST